MRPLVLAGVMGAVLVGGSLLSVPAESGALEARAAETLDEELKAWSLDQPEDYAEARMINPEWDFMARTFVVLALANRTVGVAGEDHLAVIDAIIEDTLVEEAEHGHAWFLLPYGKHGGWVNDGRSVFVDGEIALMMAARESIEPGRWTQEVQARIDRLDQDLQGFAESYPDEGWLFCHSMAIAAVTIHDKTTGQDHSATVDAWMVMAKDRLAHPETGLLVSSFQTDGAWLDGPEGSSIFLSATNLMLVDPDFAQQQYEVARDELGGSVLGMAYAREWPDSWEGGRDIDSGPLVPIIDASPSSSGFALLASAAFEDDAWHADLERSLGAADTVIALSPTMEAMADNAVGDAVLLYAANFGPLWAHVNAHPGPAADPESPSVVQSG